MGERLYCDKRVKGETRMKLRLLATTIAVIMALTIGSTAGAYLVEPQINRQIAAHTVAETARAVGYAESSTIIQAASADWWAAQNEIESQLDLLTRVVWFEAGSSWISDRQQQLVAAVVCNRVADSRFPSTLNGVVYQSGQYSCSGRLYSISASAIPARVRANAKAAAYGQVECPANVVFQAGFRQGRGVYEKGYNTYFCYG